MRRRWFILTLIVFCGFFIIISVIDIVYLWNLGPTNPCDFLHVDYSPRVFSKEGQLLWVGLNSAQQWCLPVDIHKVTPHLIDATVSIEDQRFWEHRGVDIVAVCRAIFQNIRARRIVSGASTITMQVIKQYYQQHGNGFINSNIGKFQFKLLQAIQSLRLERCATKEEILQTYLNNVSYGGNLLGVESASWRYFGKTGEVLNIGECALLAGLPKSPEIYRPDRCPRISMNRMKYVLNRMKEENYITDGQYKQYIESPLKIAFYPFPCYAQHWIARHKNLFDKEKKIFTYLDYELQVQVEEILKKRVQQWSPEISTASAMVVDVPSGEVLVRVGGVKERSRIPVSYFDFCSIPRSPGSALKPFLYCLAMEKGFLFPEEILYDSEFDVGNYAPKNFDELYHGFIDATTALRYSLNIPAVLLLERLGTYPFVERLRNCSVHLKSEVTTYKNSNLGVILGNCEVSMEEMMQAYFCLAHEGYFKPLKIVRDEKEVEGFQVFDRGSVLVLYRMMEGKLSGEKIKDAVRFSRSPTRICWKTGTSSGRKDAWAFVFNEQYVVGVWMGNPQSTGSAKLVGALSAYPVACDIFRILPMKKNEKEFPDFTDDAVKQIEVCSLSGLPVNPHCKSKKLVYVSSNTPISRICDVHYFDAQSGMVKERFPSRSRGWDLARVSTVQKGDDNEEVLTELKILNPADGAKFVYSHVPSNSMIKLRSSKDNMSTIHWYVDDQYLGSSTWEQPLWWNLVPGKHKIYCLDSSNNEDVVFVEVFLPEEMMKIAHREN